MVNIISTHHRSGKFLDNIVFLVSALSRRDSSKLVTFVFSQFVGDKVQRFLPGCLYELSVFLDKGRGQSLRVINKIIAESTFDTKITLVDRAIDVPPRTDDYITANAQIDAASAPAIRTYSLHFTGRPLEFWHQCTHRTSHNALAA
ncbi:MAG: hypothetical protein DDT33_01149 [Firmicutes bacterium]|nr:hypothetical protein [Bacillota bacterium]